MSIQYKAFDRHYGRQPWIDGSAMERTPVILASSVVFAPMNKNEPGALPTPYRHLCEDRKGFVDHLSPYTLGKSTMRIVIMQGSTILTQYMNDQLKEDMRRDELVAYGKLSQLEADEEAAQWSDQEWKKRWESFPRKLTTAMAKYHCVILLMRLYERIAEKYVDKYTLDSWTLDTFNFAQRAEKSGKKGRELGRTVFKASIKASFISYLADFSVHEVILLYGYYVFIQEQRRRNKKKLQPSSEEEIVAQGLTITLTLVKNSTLLLISRTIGLFMSSLGSAVGSCITPGWGTLLGANLGDGLAMAISDEVITLNPPVA
ncbi:hypothetical protein MPSEU_000295700 [Mayamaea pseudoterrestris]|nr:hypothetical protein MPSEU_000295700 [Mayamaea pseudoterrestris]